MKVAAALVLVLALSFAGLLGQPAPQGGKLEIDLRNLTAQRSYRLRDSIVLNFEIINEHDFLDLRAMQNPRSYFELPPYQFFGTRQKFAVTELVSKPGHYKLLAEYRCPVDAKDGKVGNFWSVERGSIVSREIEFNVE